MPTMKMTENNSIGSPLIGGGRVCYIDCVRVFAAMLVVAAHCNFSPEQINNKIWTQILGVIGSPSSELFLAISGSLLIPVKVSEREFYNRRFRKLLPPFIFWSLFGVWFAVTFNGVSTSKIPIMLFSIPFHANAIGPFWFIYTIAGLYLIAPILTPWIIQSSAKKIRFFLYLWGVSLLLPYANLFYEGFYNLKGDFTSPLYMFSGYIGYMMLGYYLRKYEIPIQSILMNIVLFITTLIPIFLVGVKMPNYRQIVMDNLQILSAIQVLAIFSFFRLVFNHENHITLFCRKVTNYTFGIYLIHTFVITLVWQSFGSYEQHPAYIMLPVVFALSFTISLIFVIVCSKFKFLRWIVGSN